MKGIAYGVGVGPGDPELMTLKAVRLIRENDIIAVPGKRPQEAAAYKIAAAAVPEIAQKTLVPVYMPMVKDRELIRREHEKGAGLIECYLDQGKNVVYLTLGDPTIYCSFSYLQHILEEDGYLVKLVSGIPSFCAAAARLNLPLLEWDESLHVIPAACMTEKHLSFCDHSEAEPAGNYVLMKLSGHIKEIKEQLKKTGMKVQAVENCGMKTEKVYRSPDEIPDDAGYFSLIIAKEEPEQ